MRRAAVPKALQTQLGEEATDGLIELFNKQQVQMTDDIVRAVVRELEPRFASIEARLDKCATKEDLRACATKDDLRDFATRDDLVRLGDRLDRRLDTLVDTVANYRADTVRWMFLFWIGQTFALLGYLSAALR